MAVFYWSGKKQVNGWVQCSNVVARVRRLVGGNLKRLSAAVNEVLTGQPIALLFGRVRRHLVAAAFQHRMAKDAAV
jgi:hypothetical protein